MQTLGYKKEAKPLPRIESNHHRFKIIYTRRNELFAGEARQEMIESFIPFDIDIYLESKEFKKIMEERDYKEK